MKAIIGLGNPGKEYADTRHNIGWIVLEALAAELNAPSFQNKKLFQAEISETFLGTEKILLVKPLTYMNLSGVTVKQIISYYKLETSQVLILQDEMDFALGKFAFTAQGGHAGHNGIRSIQDEIKTNAIARLRIGIDRPLAPLKKEDYVLQRFPDQQATVLKDLTKQATRAIQDWMTHDLTYVMNSWNGVDHGVDTGSGSASEPRAL